MFKALYDAARAKVLLAQTRFRALRWWAPGPPGGGCGEGRPRSVLNVRVAMLQRYIRAYLRHCHTMVVPETRKVILPRGGILERGAAV